jgi:hypothetical protein
MADLTGMLQAAAGAAGGDNLYIEDVFSTYVYTGNNTTNAITNGINLADEGGLIWFKQRNSSANHALYDTERGVTKRISSNNGAILTDTTCLTSFNSDGFTLATDATGEVNGSGNTYVSWTFRKAPKFFDIVTWTGNNVAGRTIAHNLGSVPGCIIVKSTSLGEKWAVYHRANTANPETDFLELNATAATVDAIGYWNDTAPTDSVFTVGNDSAVNSSGATYVAYLFAHDDGGFGDDGEQNVISCGSFTTDGSGNATVSIGYEPQWVILKPTNAAIGWSILDTMRGWTAAADGAELRANTSSAENTPTNYGAPNATGFSIVNNALGSSNTVIYIAIRRGPMKTPTAGTEVFAPIARTGTGADATISGVGFTPDFVLTQGRSSGSSSAFNDRLRGNENFLFGNQTAAENTSIAEGPTFTDIMDGVTWDGNFINTSGTTYIHEFFRRAPGFMDIVAYTGNDTAGATITHNLGVAPEMMIIKNRSVVKEWPVYHSGLNVNSDNAPETDIIYLNYTNAATDNIGFWNDTAPTSLVFTIGSNSAVNTSGDRYVAYLFASLAGISKVGSYTGNGSSVTVTTGFQPRFILVKRTDSTGNWIYGDSVRGLVAGDDPFLELNTSDLEVTNEDWVDVSATGFTINETAANANVNTGTYIYLAIS